MKMWYILILFATLLACKMAKPAQTPDDANVEYNFEPLISGPVPDGEGGWVISCENIRDCYSRANKICQNEQMDRFVISKEYADKTSCVENASYSQSGSGQSSFIQSESGYIRSGSVSANGKSESQELVQSACAQGRTIAIKCYSSKITEGEE